MSIIIQTETKHENSDLLDDMKEEYKMFEITFKMVDTGLTIKAHNHIVFPKCKNLSLLPKDEDGNILIEGIELEYFETLPFLKVLDLNRYAAKMNEAAEREAKKRG